MTRVYNYNRKTAHAYDDTSLRFTDKPLPRPSQAAHEEEVRAFNAKHPTLLANRFA